MENISPTIHPLGTGESSPMTFNNNSPSSSFGLTPLLQQASHSDCSAPPNSIGSSSGFSVRPLNLIENRLSPENDTMGRTSSAIPTASGAIPSPNIPTSLPPLSEWVPASGLLETERVLLSPNEQSDSEKINGSPHIERESTSPVPEIIDRSSVHIGFVLPDPAVGSGGSDRPPAKVIASDALNGTATVNDETSDLESLDDEVHRLLQTKDSKGKTMEAFDFPKTSRALIYNYYISRVQELRILCDQGNAMNDLPVRCEEDYALLKTLTKTYGDVRWWIIMIDDLQCPECVLLLKASRNDPKSKFEKVWLSVKGKFKRVCLCEDNRHDFVCHHTRKDMNKVTRFFHTLGDRNASRMVNISLDTNPYFHVDIDVLASAIHNAARYFKNVKQLIIKFHFHTTEPIEHERIKSIVCSMVKLEAMLPKGGRLLVCGLSSHDELIDEWHKRSRSRKWWL